MSPPSKHSDPEKVSEGSFVSFYRNGELRAKMECLNQVFYCFGVSLYNYSQVEVLVPSNNSRYFPAGALSYFDWLAEKIPYQDL